MEGASGKLVVGGDLIARAMDWGWGMRDTDVRGRYILMAAWTPF